MDFEMFGASSGGGSGIGEFGSCLTNFLDQGSLESHRYYLARRTALEMLRDRGYAVPNSEIDLSLHQFRSKYGQDPDPDRLRISTFLLNDPSTKNHSLRCISCCGATFELKPTWEPQCVEHMILVIFCGPGVVKLNAIDRLTSQIVNKDTLSGLILIVQNKITNQAQKRLEDHSFKVEIFHICDLIVNITKHELKPMHRILTDEEKHRLLKKHNLEEKQLPRMLLKDAIARYYGLQKGQVVKVTYSGEITGNHVSYRCVW